MSINKNYISYFEIPAAEFVPIRIGMSMTSFVSKEEMGILSCLDCYARQGIGEYEYDDGNGVQSLVILGIRKESFPIPTSD